MREGNKRFLSNSSIFNNTLSHKSRGHSLPENQHPFAIILGCSDSRVPAEIVFDQSLGDLFGIRVAGNIVAPSQIGSVKVQRKVSCGYGALKMRRYLAPH